MGINLKFLHTADWHLGASQHHPKQAENMLPELAKLAREKEVDFVLGVGDIYDKPLPKQRTKDQLLRFLLDNEDLKFILTVGNHDYENKKFDYSSLYNLFYLQKKLTNVRICECGLHEFDNFFLYNFGIEFTWSHDVIMEETLKKVNDKPLIASYHGIIPGINIKNPEQNEAAWKTVNNMLGKMNALYLALGDIHKHFAVSDCAAYPGCLTQKNFDSEDGIYLVNLIDDKIMVDSLHLPLPKKINLPLTFDNENVSEEAIIAFVKDEVEKSNMVRLLFNLPMETWKCLNKEYIKNELLKDYLEIKLDNDPVQEKRSRQSMDQMVKAKSTEEELDIVIAENDFNLNKDKLKKTCRRYLK